MEFFKSLSLILGVLSFFAAALLTLAGGGDGLWEHEGLMRVNRSKERVFEVLTTPELRKQWIEGLVESKVVPDGELDADSRLEEVIMVDGVRRTRILVVTDYERDSHVAFRYTDGDVEVEMRYEFRLYHGSGKCTVAFMCEAQYPGLPPKVIEPILGHMRLSRIEADLERLKATSEEGFAVRR
ncbi:MAG: SRPBCC family protein [Planctomycetota bacterium]|nr:MAG: SRPBCC family protein [Planctomycetota bacterium]